MPWIWVESDSCCLISHQRHTTHRRTLEHIKRHAGNRQITVGLLSKSSSSSTSWSPGWKVQTCQQKLRQPLPISNKLQRCRPWVYGLSTTMSKRSLLTGFECLTRPSILGTECASSSRQAFVRSTDRHRDWRAGHNHVSNVGLQYPFGYTFLEIGRYSGIEGRLFPRSPWSMGRWQWSRLGKNCWDRVRSWRIAWWLHIQPDGRNGRNGHAGRTRSGWSVTISSWGKWKWRECPLWWHKC